MQPPPEFHGPMLRAIRNHRNLTQDELAEKIGVGDDGTIRRYEKGWSMPGPLNILKLARALKVDTVNFYQPDPLRKFVSGKRIHVSVDEESSIPELDSSLKRRLKHLPQMHAGERVRFAFRNEGHVVDKSWLGWSRLDSTTAKWLGLTPGATIHCRLELFTEDNPDGIGSYMVYAMGDRAATLFDLADSARSTWSASGPMQWAPTGDDPPRTRTRTRTRSTRSTKGSWSRRSSLAERLPAFKRTAAAAKYRATWAAGRSPTASPEGAPGRRRRQEPAAGSHAILRTVFLDETTPPRPRTAPRHYRTILPLNAPLPAAAELFRASGGQPSRSPFSPSFSFPTSCSYG